MGKALYEAVSKKVVLASGKHTGRNDRRRQIMYYRVAIQGDLSTPWRWKSTVLSDLSALLQFLRLYQAFPQDRLRVFSSSSREEMHEQLMRENQGLVSLSVTVTQFLQERMICSIQGTSDHKGPGHQGKTCVSVSPLIGVNKSNSTTHTLDEKRTSSFERRRLELELGTGGDHDMPYSFALPSSLSQVLTWVSLLASVHREEKLL